MLNHEWKNLKATIPELSHYISVATGKIDEYIEEVRKTRIYTLAMSACKFLNDIAYFKVHIGSLPSFKSGNEVRMDESALASRRR